MNNTKNFLFKIIPLFQNYKSVVNEIIQLTVENLDTERWLNIVIWLYQPNLFV